jgi:DnaJ-class molecular chaperone
VPLHHERARLCAACSGKGGENVKKCPICKGQGGVVQLVQVGPGMYSQVEKDCENCAGRGELFQEGLKCKECDGRKIAKKEVDLSVPVPPGVPAGEIITMSGEGNEVVNNFIYSLKHLLATCCWWCRSSPTLLLRARVPTSF